MKYGVAEILSMAENESDIKKRVAILQANDSTVLRDVVKLAFDKVIKWAIPEGTPPYKENAVPGCQPNLYSGWRRMYLFFPGGGGEMPQLKREAFFIQFLESLDPADAKLICAVKDKSMPYKIPKAQFEKAFPGIFDFSARDR
jgi:hypothetical protein